MEGALICAIHLKYLKALVEPRFRDNVYLVQGLHPLQQIQLYQLDLAGSAYPRYTLQKVWYYVGYHLPQHRQGQRLWQAQQQSTKRPSDMA